ncbi:glycosyl hydrolase [Flagellimonas sp.]|uniref:glycosyl hydrolase n=1 Tax=Flagellimonas sp. TaxID=2058762 RepID=UPI003BA8EEB2
MKKINILKIVVISLLPLSSSIQCEMPKKEQRPDSTKIIADFVTPSEDNTIWCYWYWIGDDISKEGITKDLEAMKEAGIGGALIGNINPEEEDGKVPMLSEAWWDHMVHAVNEGNRLGVDIGVFNCPGWSQSGGPWITPEMAMRYKVYSETEVQGPGRVNLTLPKPTENFQDTYTIAFPKKANDFKTTSSNTRVTTIPALGVTNLWFDGNDKTGPFFNVKENKEYKILFKTDKPFKARNITLTPNQTPFECDCTVEAKINDSFKEIADISFTRQKMTPNVGPNKQGPLSISFSGVESDIFRLTCKNFKGFEGQVEKNEVTKVGFSEIFLTSELILDQYIEKQLAKMHPTPFPAWDSYLWEKQALDSMGLEIAKKDIVDISGHVLENGELDWQVPEGTWIVQRYGMTPTGTKNAPSAPQGKGYEVDKMSEELARFHFEQFVGKLWRMVPEENRSALKYVVADSYEMGSQNWTDDFEKKFMKIYGYDPVVFLPVYSGRVVQDIEASNRFLWDVRRLVADQVAYEYVGGLRKISNEYGMQLWLENYGHWGFPSEFLMYGGQSDLVSGEFWNEGTLGNIECKAASSAAHIYGKSKVSAEAFTAANRSFVRHPAMLKKRGDWSFTEGINHFVLHLYIHQPDDQRVPGVNAWFSTEFNRHNTWFKKAGTYFDYLRRSQHLLQQGTYSADICYFIGENTPIMTGVRQPEIPEGYSYDYINAEVILNRLTVKDGKFILPDGMSYRVMVLPPFETMRPEVLEKLESLVAAGGHIYGQPPIKSPSLKNFPKNDHQVQKLAEKMWGSDTEKVKNYGKGTIVDGMELQKALDSLKIQKDVELGDDAPILWTHRNMPGMDIYFLTNQSDEEIAISPSFRVKGLKPQLWNAVTGEVRALNEFTEADNRTIVPLRFKPSQSWFLIFTNSEEGNINPGYSKNFPEPNIVQPLENPWEVNFLNKNIGPEDTVEFLKLTDWSKIDRADIKYYSGTAVYSSTFNFKKSNDTKDIYIDLGNVGVMATVRLNGEDLGTTWTVPYRLNASKSIRDGENLLEVEVVNVWRNRITGDRELQESERTTWLNIDNITSDEELVPSGLIGPVTIQTIR